MRPITIKGRMALEYDAAFVEWLSCFEDGKDITDPQVLVMNELIGHMSAFRVAIAVREDIEE